MGQSHMKSFPQKMRRAAPIANLRSISGLCSRGNAKEGLGMRRVGSAYPWPLPPRPPLGRSEETGVLLRSVHSKCWDPLKVKRLEMR